MNTTRTAEDRPQLPEPKDVDDLDNYDDTVDALLSYLTDQFGPYPFDRFGIALADSASGLAMETQGLPLFSQDDLDGSLGTDGRSAGA